MEPIQRIARAYDFAARKHAAQRRKGINAEPYVNHLTEVADLLAEATSGADADLVIAGILHDTLEDTDTEREHLVQHFGETVAALVAEVTDNKALPKAERKRLQIEHAAHASDRAKMIKLADKTSNLRSLASSPPADWAYERIIEYLDWAHAVVAGCRGINRELEAHFDAAYDDGKRAIG